MYNLFWTFLLSLNVFFLRGKRLDTTCQFATINKTGMDTEAKIILKFDQSADSRPMIGLYISQLIRFARVCSNADDFNNRNLFLTAKLLKQGYWYHKIRKAFSKFYYRHSELIVKYNIGLKTLLQQGISEPIFYGDLVYKFKRIVGKPNFIDQFKKIVKRYIRVGYNLDIMRQSACQILNPITVFSYGFLFNCTTVGQASDSMTALT